MTADSFVNAIERYVRDSAVDSMIKNLSAPTSNHDHHLIEASEWYRRLSDDQKRVFTWVIKLTANHTALGFLAVIDGSRAIEGGPGKGHLELYHVRGSDLTLLNDPNNEPLNDKLRP
jgi:hypothetical protein